MGSGRTTCGFCGESVPSGHLKRHILEQHSDDVRPLPYTSRLFKVLIFYSMAMYLFGFSLSGTNVFGFVDSLIPLERVFCGFLSGCCVVEFTINLKKLIRTARKTVTIENIGVK